MVSLTELRGIKLKCANKINDTRTRRRAEWGLGTGQKRGGAELATSVAIA